MEEIKERLKDITQIRSILEQQTKFLSLSGLSGVWAGLTALFGAAAAWYWAQNWEDYSGTARTLENVSEYLPRTQKEIITIFLSLASAIILIAVVGAWFFSKRMAQRKSLPFWNQTAKRMMLNLFIPLAAGGAICIIQLWQGRVEWIASNMLVFYGLALLNASKFTMNEISYLGYSEIGLGLLCAIWWGHGFWFWVAGFGVLHIVYGVWMYYKYER